MNLLYRHIIAPVRDLLYPPLCLSCSRYLEEDGTRVCRDCWDRIVRITPDHPTWAAIHHRLRDRGNVRGLIACFLYEGEGPLRDLLHLLKYGGMSSLGIRLGRELGGRLRAAGCTPELLIPVPLHRIVQRERGYNQSESICRGIEEITGTPVETRALRRVRHTKSQTHLSLELRSENVAGAFAVEPGLAPCVAGKRLLLVDDVMTTGSTVSACAESLIASGAAEVGAASIALAR